MNDVFATKGILTVSIGEGFLSSFEASTLKRGDVVRTTKLAGHPSTVLFNGTPLCSCEVVILTDIFGVRILDADPEERPAPGPGTRDDLVEILPTTVSLGAISLSLAELKEAGPGALISLGRKFSVEQDAELFLAGIPIARGKVVVIEEEMGIRVTEATTTAFRESNVRASGFVIESGAAALRIKDYDFRRPDKFSKAQIDRMREIHTLFLRNVKARLPEFAEVLAEPGAPPVVDQCTYGEILELLRTHGTPASIIAENLPLSRMAAAFRSSRMPAAPSSIALLEEATPAHRVNPEVRVYIEKLRREHGFPTRSPVFIFYDDVPTLRKTLTGAEGQEALLAALRGGWKNFVDLHLRPVDAEDAIAQPGAIPENEMVIVITLGRDGTGKSPLTIVYPYLTLEPYIGILG